MNKITIGTAVIALVVGFGAGYVVHTSPAQAPGAGGNFARNGSAAFGGMRAGGGGLLSGTVAKQDATSMTLNTRDGSSHIVLLTPNTSVSKSVGGAVSDISVGANIIVSGTTNSDGSVSASLIQLRPAAPPATVGQ